MAANGRHGTDSSRVAATAVSATTGASDTAPRPTAVHPVTRTPARFTPVRIQTKARTTAQRSREDMPGRQKAR